METNEIKKAYGDSTAFLLAFNPEKQILVSDLDKAITDNYPTMQEICLTYGEDIAEAWTHAQIVNLTCFANCDTLTKSMIKELSKIIVKECQQSKISEILHFFYCLKSGRYVCTDGKVSPMAITFCLRQFLSEVNGRNWFLTLENNKKVFLIVDDQPNKKVYARVFRSKENAEKALEERDYRTGERLYPACHIIERSIE